VPNPSQTTSHICRHAPATPPPRVKSRDARHAHAVHQPARRATATVARVTPCDSVACGLVLSHLSALAARESKRKLGSDLRGGIFFTTPAPPAQSHRLRARRVVARPSPLRSRLSRNAALPRHERAASSLRRESGDYIPGAQICDCAGGAVAKMPSLAARAVPPASVARLLAAWCGLAEWRSVQGESPAPRGVKSEQGSPALSRATICRNRAGRVASSADLSMSSSAPLQCTASICDALFSERAWVIKRTLGSTPELNAQLHCLDVAQALGHVVGSAENECTTR